MDRYLGYLGKRVRRAREEFGYSQQGLADVLARYGAAVTQATINNIEVGRRKPSVEVLLALSLALQVSTDYLMGLSDDQSPPTGRVVSEAQLQIESLFGQLSSARQHELLVIAGALADDQTEPSTDQFDQVINAALDLLTDVDPAMADALLSRLNDDAMPIVRRLLLQRQRAE